MNDTTKPPSPRPKVDLTPLLHPKSVAIIGVSQNKIGGMKFFFANQASGFMKNGGNMYLINPKFKELYGQPVYPSLTDPAIPKPIDLTIISVPAEHVPSVVRQLNKSLTRFASIYTSGFGESDNESLDADLKDAIAHSDVRFLGPNCLGVLNPGHKLAIYPDWETEVGPISWAAQSGGMMGRLYHFIQSVGIGFRYALSIGNMYDLQPIDLFNHFAHDDKTKVIAFYLESIRDGREFMTAAARVTPQKPIILWKGGQTQRGVSATHSHTGGLAGSFEIWKAACRQSGIMMAHHFEQFADLAQVATLLHKIPPKSLNVAIVVAGGGIGVEFSDLFEHAGLSIPDLEPSTQQQLEAIFGNININFKNPVDLGEKGYDPHLFAKAMDVILQDKNVGCVVFVREPERFPVLGKLMGIQDPQKLTVETLTEIVQQSPKPIICTPSTNRDTPAAFALRHEFQKAMIKAGLPVINYVANIPHVLKELYLYGRYVEAKKDENA